MNRILIAALVTALSITFACSNPKDVTADHDVQISATDLYKLFSNNADSAKKEFEGKNLKITGEISSLFDGAPPGSHPSITFKTDTFGIVVCEGDALIQIFSKLQIGQKFTVNCSSPTFFFSPQPNNSLVLTNCYPKDMERSHNPLVQ